MQTRNDNWVSDHDMWDWTGMSSGSVYGDGPDRFGAGYTPGEYEGTARLAMEGWLPEYTIKYTEYSDGVARVNSVKLTGYVKRGDGSGGRQSRGPEDTQGGLSLFNIIHYTIDQVLAMHGYGSRQAYLFPTESAASRVLPLLLVMDGADLAEKAVDATRREWDRRIGDLDEADIKNLNRYLGDLFTLNAKLLVRIQALQTEIENLRGVNATGEIINERSFKMWDYEYQLNPVSIEIDKVKYSLDHRVKN
jgi:hypothetical protein